MIKDHHYTCAHPSCGCRVTPPSLYCAEVCRDAADKDSASDAGICPCGHEACIAKRNKQAERR